MKKNYCRLLVFFIFVIGVIPVAAWNDAGHKTIAYIAWEKMTPAAREKAFNILMSAPEDSDLSVFYTQDSRSEAARKREFFMIAATWADIIRDRKFKNRFETYHHSNWHYSDTFWTTENGAVKILANPEGEGGMALEKLYDFEKVLQNETAPDAEKAIAIAWIEHLIGDLHQPLHTSGRVTELEPKGDQGGNLFLLTPKDTPREKSENLHWFWDSILDRNIPREDACDSDYVSPIAETIMKKYPLAEMQKRLETGKFDEWQKESFKDATTEVFTTKLVRYEMPTAEYRRNALLVAERQMALAGYRLAALFNQLFDGTTSSETTTQPANCRIIRRVPYPITQMRSDQKLEIALLDLCPADAGKVARPMMSQMVKGKITYFEYDVIKVFSSEKEAKKYAEENKITDAQF